MANGKVLTDKAENPIPNIATINTKAKGELNTTTPAIETNTNTELNQKDFINPYDVTNELNGKDKIAEIIKMPTEKTFGLFPFNNMLNLPANKSGKILNNTVVANPNESPIKSINP